MHVTITFKLSAETKDELINSFGGKWLEFRGYVEELQSKGVLPKEAKIRWLVVGGRWE